MALILLTMMGLVVAAAAGGSATYLWAMRRLPRPQPGAPQHKVPVGPIFLFHGDDLFDATPDAQQMIAPFAHLPDREAMLHVLAPQFPALPDHLAQDAKAPVRIAHLHHDSVWLDLDWPNGQMRLTIQGTAPGGYADLQSTELALLRDVTRFAPHLIWRTGPDGKIVWANQAYLDFWARMHPAATGPLAEKTVFEGLTNTLTTGKPTLRRVCAKQPLAEIAHWFDIASVSLDDAALHFATDASASVRADQDRRNFIQTLGKTFAELSIGLAIFDKRRQLATFNPALLDMTRLSFAFLSARPTIDTVLDRLRETRILPEPKNYASWRDRFSAVETAAKNGTYSEVWNLPDGQAFRVTGRPHPDGAFAFLFEDITADLSMTRRFRSDIETGQAVLDALPDAVAVFSGAGTLVIHNRAYVLLWGLQTEHDLAHRDFDTERSAWQARSLDSSTWVDLAAFMRQTGPRQPWEDDALLADGRLIRCQASPIAGGMLLVRFSAMPHAMPTIRKPVPSGNPLIRTAKG